ncbi:xylose isomerase [Bacillus sp. J14TS2]|uniref:sugar phosphate isomerase/epimerase family protein n=1 Tax=Bacillus sp. J14TS2 TaxID=2807188 RepID=UPI001B05A369|nr:sugar phosphate isomerase/epimerase family protein [Bacillus sp. J14TS2]GIN72139.1 xylose isomerase [Bacillus sp. J14TS2]
MSYLSVSTWSLHRLLGPLRWTAWDNAQKKHITKLEQQDNVIDLLDLPTILKEKGFAAFELCHFHFPFTDSLYLQRLKKACTDANMRLYTLLLDYGDLSSTDTQRVDADMELIKEWIDIAAEVGAERVRVVAGDAPADDQDALSRVSQYLHELAVYAGQKGVKIITENFRTLSSTSENCLYIVNQSDEQIRLITDFGNMSGAEKYNELARIIPYSDSIHAKPQYDKDGIPDQDEFRRCLDLLKQAHYDGPIVIIYDGPGDMWEGIERTKKIVEDYL